MKETNGKHNYQHLTPSTVTGQRFTQYYNHGWDFIKKEEGTWTTINEYPISPREIWDKHQDPHQIIGLRFGSNTKHITLDLDINGICHPTQDPKPIKTITEALESIGLCRHVCIQSSDSQGIHLIFPLPEPLHTFKTACLVKATLEAAGLEIKTGQLEIFPNPKRYAKNGKKSRYNGVRLPLQPNSGSYLLDEDLNIISDSIEDFLDQMDWAAQGQDIETFSSQLEPAYEEYKGKKRWQNNGKSRKAQEWETALEQIVSKGWTGHHQTNYLLPKFVAYCIVFQQCVGAKLREAVTEAVINAPGYREWCRHQHEIDKRVEEVCYYTERNQYYLKYCNFPNRSTNFNQTYNPQAMENKLNKRTEDIQTRLIQTVAHLESKGELPQQVARRREAIIETAQELFGKGFSCRTLGQKQYRVLWHPKYRPSQSTIEKPETVSKPTTVKKPPVSQSKPTKAPLPTKPKREKSKIQTVKKQCKPKPTEKLNQVRVKSSQKSQKMAKPQTTEMKVSRTQKIEKRLIGAVAHLEAKRELPQQVALRREAIIETAKKLYGLGFSNRTLSHKKYLVLWHPKHRTTTKTEQTPSNRQTTPKKNPQKEPRTKAKASPSKQVQSQSQSENVSFSPIYEVFDRQKSEPQSKTNLKTTTTTSSPAVSTDPLSPGLSDAPIKTSSDESSTNGQPRKLSKKKLLEKCDDYGIEVNRTIERLIKSNTSEVVLNALEALREHKRQGQVKNPSGFLVKAIKQKWKPTTATNTPQTSSKPSSSLYPSNPTAGITDEFLQWYEKQIARGLVENVPVHHLPLYQHREPMVKVLTPDSKFPYDLMRWTQARELYPSSNTFNFD